MTERNRFIDLAKGIAIILVLFNHYEFSPKSIFSTHIYYWIVCMAVPVFMLCTGYVTAASYSSKNVAVRQAYSKEALVPKLCRYVLPVLWFYVAETVLTFIFQKTGYLDYIGTLDFPYRDGYGKKMTLLGSIIFFFAGGRGQHGTYYFPVIMQVAFMIPLIYAAVKKWKWGVWLCFGINLALEILKNPLASLLVSFGISSKVPYGAYRLLAFRYIFIIALGCYVYLYRDRLGKWYKWAVFAAIGAVYIYLVNYEITNRLIFTYWHRTAMPVAFFVAPAFVLGIKYLAKVRFTPLEELGKASYHILMVQILYYNFFAPLVWTAPKNVIPNAFVGMLISLVVCLAGGYGYYKLYGFVAGKYKMFKSKK